MQKKIFITTLVMWFLSAACSADLPILEEKAHFKIKRTNENEKIVITNHSNEPIDHEITTSKKDDGIEHHIVVPLQHEAKNSHQYIKVQIIQN